MAAMERLDDDTPWYKRLLVKYRRPIGCIVPGAFVHVFWWILFIDKDMWSLYQTGYPMAITMIFGSLIAGKYLKHNDILFLIILRYFVFFQVVQSN